MSVIKLNRFLSIPYVDNFYSEEELADIFHELRFLNKNNKLNPPTETGTATDSNGVPIKSNTGVFLDDLYADRKVSDILRLNRKLFKVDVTSPFPCMKALKKSDYDTTLLSYYESSDYYKSHVDNTVLTALTYFYETPKKFSGGDLYLREYGATLPCVHNRLYLIPGLLEHEVTPVEMNPKDEKKGLGRYCMSQFLNFR